MSIPPPARPELPEGIVRVPGEGPPPVPERVPARDELPRWAPWAPFAAMLLTLVVAIAGATVIAVIASLAGADVSAGNTPPGVAIGGTLVQDLGLILSAVVFAKANAGTVRARDFGLRRTQPLRALGWIALAAAIFIVVSNIYAAAVNAPETSNQADDLGAGDSTLNLIVVALLVCVVAPVAEEFFFRGFCFTALRRWLGWVPAAIVTGLIFGGIHVGSVDPLFLPPLALLGFLLCVLYRQTGSLVPCMGLHALNNGLALGYSQDFSALGTVATMLGASLLVVTIGLLAADSRRLNAVPATA